MKTTTDFHQNGAFAVKDQTGNILFDTFDSTAYSARAKFGQLYNKKWRAAEKLGYTMFGYAEVVQVLTEPREGTVDTVTGIESRIAELDDLEQPLEVIQAGNGGDFGQAEFDELHRLRDARDGAGTEFLHIPRTADEWDLYSDKEGAEAAAEALGEKLYELVVAAIKAGNRTLHEAERIRDIMYVEMAQYEGIGASDTEPLTILVTRIESAMGLTESLSR